MKIHHLAIWVNDLEKIKAFYTKYYGAKAGEMYVNPVQNFKSYFLEFEEGCKLEIMNKPSLTNASVGDITGYTHLAISAGSKQEVDRITEPLRKDGYQIAGEPRTTGDGFYESVVLDPEGNRIEITV